MTIPSIQLVRMICDGLVTAIHASLPESVVQIDLKRQRYTYGALILLNGNILDRLIFDDDHLISSRLPRASFKYGDPNTTITNIAHALLRDKIANYPLSDQPDSATR